MLDIILAIVVIDLAFVVFVIVSMFEATYRKVFIVDNDLYFNTYLKYWDFFHRKPYIPEDDSYAASGDYDCDISDYIDEFEDEMLTRIELEHDYQEALRAASEFY